MRQPKPSELNKLVSLTFDADPSVRIEAAESLAKFDDPAALFALAELSYDKEPEVRNAAQKMLEGRKNGEEAEVMSFAEIFSKGKDDEEGSEEKKEDEVPKERKEKMLQPITKIIEKRWGKEKAELMKSKMMPSIDKIYNKSKKTENEQDSGRKAMQEFLTSYLEVVSDINPGDGSEVIPEIEGEVEAAVNEDLAGEIGELGTKEIADERIAKEIAEIEQDEIEDQRQEDDLGKLPDTFVKKAYETMMLSGGDESMMKKEMKRMISSAENDIKLAFKMAKSRYKKTKITHISEIKNKMRNINTDLLTVAAIDRGEYQKTKKAKAQYTRLAIIDEEGNEGLIYLFDNRGDPLSPGMKVKIEKGYAKTFKFSGETALTLGKNGFLYIVL
jgi:hypothetical protein